ncbi:MAG: HD domain-containing protein [Acidimicrobiia bacterium]
MADARITRLDTATAEEWALNERVAELVDNALPERVLALMRTLDGMDDGFAVDQLGHALQTATRAEHAGADDELVVGALVHDLGKIFGDDNHDRVSAEILRPYVRDEVYRVVRHHQDFTARYIAPVLGGDPARRESWRNEPWFALAERFADEWDQTSFDPEYATERLEHFEPAVRRVMSLSDQREST